MSGLIADPDVMAMKSTLQKRSCLDMPLPVATNFQEFYG
jgi:hypothetical protein